MRKFKKVFFAWMAGVLLLAPLGIATGEDTAETAKKVELPAPKSELDNLKAEWEAVREQQIQMIREKEDQLEKLKEEIFAKMKALNIPTEAQPVPSKREVVPQSSAMPLAGTLELEAQKAAFKSEKQKFFAEMSRQKEGLRQLQAALDEKAKQLEAERNRFEQEKKTAAR